MRVQRSGGVRPVGRCDELEFVVLVLLLEAGGPALWSLGELAREVGCELATTRAIAGLDAAGLVNRCGRFVWPSRAACRFCELLRE